MLDVWGKSLPGRWTRATPGQVWRRLCDWEEGRRRVEARSQRPCVGCFPFFPTHSPPFCSLGSCLWPNQQAPLTSGFLWDLANGRHLQELRGRPAFYRESHLSDDLQQLGVALCTSGWKWGYGWVPNTSPGLPAPRNGMQWALVASLKTPSHLWEEFPYNTLSKSHNLSVISTCFSARS